MLLAYTLSATGNLAAGTIAALRAAEAGIARDVFAGRFDGLGLGWDGVAPGPVDGVFVRGYARAESRPRAIAMIEALRRLSREFPGVDVLLSGWGDLPPTTIRAGGFELFAEAYERALAEHRPDSHWPLQA
jgi:hypothetical protein